MLQADKAMALTDVYNPLTQTDPVAQEEGLETSVSPYPSRLVRLICLCYHSMH
jgi:hypothetical protein